jgi:hypothetical protein
MAQTDPSALLYRRGALTARGDVELNSALADFYFVGAVAQFGQRPFQYLFGSFQGCRGGSIPVLKIFALGVVNSHAAEPNVDEVMGHPWLSLLVRNKPDSSVEVS